MLAEGWGGTEAEEWEVCGGGCGGERNGSHGGDCDLVQ